MNHCDAIAFPWDSRVPDPSQDYDHSWLSKKHQGSASVLGMRSQQQLSSWDLGPRICTVPGGTLSSRTPPGVLAWPSLPWPLFSWAESKEPQQDVLFPVAIPRVGRRLSPILRVLMDLCTPLKGKGLWAVGLRLLRVPQGKDGAQFPPWKGCLCLKKQQRGLSQLPLMFLLHGREGSRAASSTGIIPGAAWGGWVMAPHVCCG